MKYLKLFNNQNEYDSFIESNSKVAAYLDISNGFVTATQKFDTNPEQYVRPFAIID